MGTCFGTKDSQTKITLKHMIVRLKTAAPLEKAKLQKKLEKDEATLIENLQKPKASRNRPIEECLIEQVVCLIDMIQRTFSFISIVWGLTENCCTKIIDYYVMLEDQQNFTHIQKEIENLLFLKSVLNNRDLDEIYKSIIRRYKLEEPIVLFCFTILQMIEN